MPDKAKQVLLVEDEDNIALALSVLIEREGYIIDRVDDGDRAIETLNRSKPDLVVLDAMLPAELLVLLFSAAGQKFRSQALDIGADAFLLKPFDTRELTQQVRAMLDGPINA